MSNIDKPWVNDRLHREDFAKHFVDLLHSRFAAKSNFIVNLDAPWGTGKTYFLENLAGQLRSEGFAVAYINAWEDDRSDDPIISVLATIDGALKARLGGKEEIVQKLAEAKKRLGPVVAEVGKQLGMHALKVGLGISMQKLIDVANAEGDYEVDEEAIEKGLDAARAEAAPYVQSRLDAQLKERMAIKLFRDDVAALLAKSEIPPPLFVIIDELDRCRPTYAVKMLEDLRHIFAIPGVVFVVGTDSVQLSHSVRALYGSEFDSATYLRRFFDRVVVFPPVSNKAFLMGMFHQADIDPDAIFYSDHQAVPVDVFSSLFEVRGYSYRDMQQFFEILETLIASWNEPLPLEPVYLAALIDDYLADPRTYSQVDGVSNLVERSNWKVGSGRTEVNLRNMSHSIQKLIRQDLTEIGDAWPRFAYFAAEHNKRMGEKPKNGPWLSILNSYKNRVHLSARLVYQRLA